MFAALTKPWGIGANPTCSGLPLISSCPSWLPPFCCCWLGRSRYSNRPPASTSAAAAKLLSLNIHKLAALARHAPGHHLIGRYWMTSSALFLLHLAAREKCKNPGRSKDCGSDLGSNQQALTSLTPIQRHIHLHIIFIYFAFMHCSSFTFTLTFTRSVLHFYLLRLPIRNVAILQSHSCISRFSVRASCWLSSCYPWLTYWLYLLYRNI